MSVKLTGELTVRVKWEKKKRGWGGKCTINSWFHNYFQRASIKMSSLVTSLLMFGKADRRQIL